MATVQMERVGQVAMVVADGRFVGKTEINELDALLTKLVEDDGEKKILVNLTGTGLMSSMALGVLIKTQRAATARGAHLALCGLHPRLRSVVVRCFGSLLQLFDRCDEALQALQKL